MLTKTKIEQIINNGENERVEFKQSISDINKIKRTICAFSNDLSRSNTSGYLIIGVNDKEEIKGFSVTDENIKKISEIKSSGQILPQPKLNVDKYNIDGKEIMVVEVQPSYNPPVRFDGRIYIRVGTTTRLASDNDETILVEKRVSAKLHYDSRPVQSAKLDELDIQWIESNYLPNAIDRDILQKNNRSIENRLISLRFLSSDGIPTNGAVILFGIDPRAYIPGAYLQFLRIEGKELTDPIKDQKELFGPLYRILERLDDLIDINISINTEVLTHPTEIKKPDYPKEAIVQLARNALMHRDYEGSNSPVKLYWYSDRIEIQNAGGLYGQVTPENFGKGTTDYRNPLIAEAMKVMGYVQRFGIGIPTVKKELEKNGNPPPEFYFDYNNFLAIIRRRL